MMKKRKYIYPLAQQTWGPEEKAAIGRVIASDSLTMGDEVQKFQREFASWAGAKFAVMVNSGSSANLLCLESLLRPIDGSPKLQSGDEVIVPALSWGTTVWPVIQLGLKPVVVDIELSTLGISPTAIESAISEKTRAIIVVHVLGQPCNLAEITHICEEHNLILIEDCCESLGAKANDTHVGNFGLYGTFSFYFSHHVSTIEGGMITTNDTNLFNDLLSMRAHGWSRDRTDANRWSTEDSNVDPRFVFLSTGFNFRPTEIEGALGRIQLQRFPDMIKRRRELARRVDILISDHVDWLKLIGRDLLTDDSTNFHSFMCLPFILDKDAPVTRSEFCEFLESSGIETRPIIAGNILRHPAARYISGASDYRCRMADQLYERGFMIGCHPYITEQSWSTFEEAITRASDL